MNAKRELWLLVACLMLGSAAFAETKVEVTLVDRLDEPRGFCFDTLGFQAQARPEEGLQAHSCYLGFPICGYGTFTHPSSRHALICAGSA